MGIRLLSKISSNAKQFHKLQSLVSSSSSSTTKHSHETDVPKGHLAVYVGEMKMKKTRFVVPITYLNHPSFQDLLRRAEEEYGYDHPMGGLTIPCEEQVFLSLTSRLKFLS